MDLNRRDQRFVTLTRSDKEFSRYLLGEGPDGLRAVPVQSYAINSPRERVTFALMAPELIARPRGWVRVGLALRLELLPLTLAPLLVSLVAILSSGGEVPWWKALCALLSLTALHAATFSRNDFEDHLQGLDRIQRQRGSQVIQKGWLSALEVRNLSWATLALSVLLVLPLLWPFSVSVALLLGLGLAAVLGFSFKGRGFKNQGAGDFVVGLCMGPLLTLGVGQLFAHNESLWLASVGLPLGLGAVIVFQMRQLETILAEKQSRVGTLMSRMGFDRAKRILNFELLALPLLTGLSLALWVPPTIAVLVTFLVAFGQWPLRRRLKQVASPLSSTLLGLARSTLWFYFAMALILILAIGRMA